MGLGDLECLTAAASCKHDYQIIGREEVGGVDLVRNIHRHFRVHTVSKYMHRSAKKEIYEELPGD